MHEMSLAMSVMAIVEREMERQAGRTLTAVEIEIGEQAGVERQSFDTAIDAVFRSSRFAGASIEIHPVEARAQCLMCDHTFRPRSLFPECPECGSSVCGVTAGREFRVTALRLGSGH